MLLFQRGKKEGIGRGKIEAERDSRNRERKVKASLPLTNLCSVLGVSALRVTQIKYQEAVILPAQSICHHFILNPNLQLHQRTQMFSDRVAP